MSPNGPPAHAWDWIARQRSVWREIRRRLVAAGYGAPAPAAPGAGASRMTERTAGDVPDWSVEHPDLRLHEAASRSAAGGAGGASDTQRDPRDGPRDYLALDTRAGCIAALRDDYPRDAALRAIVDAVVTDVAFLGRLDGTLHALGVRTAPRGMRWWWTHLTGRDADEGRSASAEGASPGAGAALPTQLRLVDVLAGYGDVMDA